MPTDDFALRPGFTQEDRRGLPFILNKGVGNDFGRANPRDRVDTLLGSMLSEAFSLADVEDSRDREALDFERGEFESFNRDFEGRQDRLSRMFRSQASDQIGAQAREGFRGLRGMIGRRGLNPNSGTAAALADRIAGRQQGQLIGARRDIALDEERRRRDHALTRLQAGGKLADRIATPPSVLRLDAIQDVTGVLRAKSQEAEARSQSRKLRKDAMIAGGLNAAGTIAGAFI
ncbi:MAG: hypothetical protein GY720_15920 [bacterium]|nr:hypothetical protein [bacterium]